MYVKNKVYVKSFILRVRPHGQISEIKDQRESVGWVNRYYCFSL
jgi:hypothetical protein